MAKVRHFAKAFAGRWRIVEMDTTGTATSSILSKKRISPSKVGPAVKLPSAR
jgi:hypothetical protein